MSHPENITGIPLSHPESPATPGVQKQQRAACRETIGRASLRAILHINCSQALGNRRSPGASSPATPRRHGPCLSCPLCQHSRRRPFGTYGFPTPRQQTPNPAAPWPCPRRSRSHCQHVPAIARTTTQRPTCQETACNHAHLRTVRVPLSSHTADCPPLTARHYSLALQMHVQGQDLTTASPH